VLDGFFVLPFVYGYDQDVVVLVRTKRVERTQYGVAYYLRKNAPFDCFANLISYISNHSAPRRSFINYMP
jgi:hypothetical protein